LDELEGFKVKNTDNQILGGREEGLKQLGRLENIDYTKRNKLSCQTSRLSAYIELGCLSIREIFYKSKEYLSNEDFKEFARQLFWRDFYIRLMNYKPKQLIEDGEKTRNFKWNYEEELFIKWKKGRTGFPMVDATMRQLNKTGYCHNRGRLVASNFLVKGLFIDWRKGAKYYRDKLIDHSLALNNANWQWTAGTQAFSQPYFRYISPYSSKKFDPSCEYIKRWVSELREVPSAQIHSLKKDPHLVAKGYNYYEPIIDWQHRIEEFKRRWKCEK
jgi:deoxyribodipyrimidine photo-lyase